jgi:hypothetical protein
MSSPIVSANLVTASALNAAAGGLTQGTADQWNFILSSLINGTNPTTGQPNTTPYTAPAPECFGFGTCGCPNGTSSQSCCGCPNPANPVYQRSQPVTAQQYLSALQSWQQQFVSNGAVNGGAPASTGTTQATNNPPVATTNTTVVNTGQATAAACPAGQTCQILGNGIPDAYVVLGGIIVIGLAVVIYLKDRKK